jgi:hypothetical protein
MLLKGSRWKWRLLSEGNADSPQRLFDKVPKELYIFATELPRESEEEKTHAATGTGPVPNSQIVPHG